MPRRYRSKSTRRKSSNSQGRLSSRSRARSTTPGWHWLLTGMTLGGLIVVFLNMNQVDTVASSLPDQEQVASPQYEFYHLLSRSSQVNSQKTEAKQSVVQAPKVKIQKETKLSPQVKSSVLTLQAAAFSSSLQAKQLLRRIKRMEMPAAISQVDRSGVLWYRVLVTPIASEKEALAYQDKLTNIGLEAQLVW